MRIKFKKPDPRAGSVVQMDSSRGQHFIDTGSAVAIKEDGTEAQEPQAVTRALLDLALANLPGGNDDPEYVVRSMRSYFGDLFTDEDEAAVRKTFKDLTGKPSDGLTVPQLKEALASKGIAIPDGVTLKAELADLLDNHKDD